MAKPSNDAATHNVNVTVQLRTSNGKADIVVPPYLDWSSSARHALSAAGGGDDWTWAERTLDPASLAAWRRLDPTGVETGTFFGEVAKALGGVSLGESPASTHS